MRTPRRVALAQACGGMRAIPAYRSAPGRGAVPGRGAPFGDRDDAGREQRQAAEQGGDLGVAARGDRRRDAAL